MAVQKVNSKKLKAKKLEERIAPGMVGGGVIDPGMTDSAEMPQDSDKPEVQSLEKTEIGSDYIEHEPAEHGEHYAEENYATESSGDIQQDTVADHSDSELKTSFDESAPSGDYMVELDSWREPDWVTANADGSVTVQPPEGVSVENGIANFPAAVANDALPLPENISLQTDGTVNVAVPEGTVYNAEMGTLTLPAGEAEGHDVPSEFQPVSNPDGTLTITLPESGAEYNADTHTLNLSNDLANEIAPSHLEINADGSLSVALPEGTELKADGSFTIPADQTHFIDNPPPEYVAEIDFAEYQADGSCHIELPEGATVRDGYANFPHDLAMEELPIPDDVQINADGTANIGLPEGAVYNADANSINFPADSFNPDECPQGIQSFSNADGSWTVMMAEGMDYDASSNTVHMSNYWVNEFAPDPVYVGADGSVAIELPPGTEYASPTEFTIPAGQADFMENSCPDYVHDAAFAEPMGDGSYSINPPEGVIVNDMQMQFPHEMVAAEVPMPYDMTVAADGSISVPVPEGTQYNEEFKQLTFPAGAVQLAEIPQGIDAHLNPDGSVTAVLPDGISYQSDSGSITANNLWANELAPANVEISESGAVTVTMPADVSFQPDGSIVIPAESADFIQNPDPAYCVAGPDWVEANADGSITFEPPAEVQVNVEQGTITMTPAVAMENFENYIPEGMQFYPDGSIDMPLPEGTVYNAEMNAITIPAGNLNTEEIPTNISHSVDAAGAITIQLPNGMEYNAETAVVHMDNYWANEVAPESIEIQANGQIEVTLPPHTSYYEGGGFNVPAPYADFVDNPPPAYVYNGPEWVNASADGTVHFTPMTEVQINPEAGTATMSIDAMNEHFENQIPESLTFNADGTVNVQLPADVKYDAATGVVTFSAETAHQHMPPPQLQPYFNEDGSLSVKLPPGIDYDANTQQVHLNNEWTNEL